MHYLRQQSAQRQTLKELKRLYTHIQREHTQAKARAESCGINAARFETLELIKKDCAALENEMASRRMAARIAVSFME